MLEDELKQLLAALRSGERSVTVWGLGYIGLTSAEALLSAGYRVAGIDTSAARLEEISRGPVFLNAESRGGVDLRPFHADGLLRLCADADALSELRIGCHFVCVPTEREGKAYQQAISAVLATSRRMWPKTPVIVESTLSPSWLLQPGVDDERLIVAPRRDWFHSQAHTLRALTRIVGADPGVRAFALALLSDISDSIVFSEDKIAVATTKAFENSLWFLLFSYVGELATTRADCDLKEVLRLARTNWRTPFDIRPEFQVGGYCLPLTYPYLADFLGEDAVPLLAEAAAANTRMIEAVARKVKQSKARSALILGLTYRPGLRVVTNSAGALLVKALSAAGLSVQAHDPLLTREEVERTGAAYCDVPAQLDACECVIVCTDHRYYREMDAGGAIESSARVSEVLDCGGTLQRYSDVFAARNVKYRQLATRSW